MSDEVNTNVNTTQQNKSMSRKFVLVCWFMILVTMVIISHFVCTLFSKTYPLTEIIAILGLTVTTIITYVTGNVYQKSHTLKSLTSEFNSDSEKAPI